MHGRAVADLVLSILTRGHAEVQAHGNVSGVPSRLPFDGNAVGERDQGQSGFVSLAAAVAPESLDWPARFGSLCKLAYIGFDVPADGLKIVLQGEHHGPELLQKILGAEELDGEPGGGELDTGGQPGEAGADQLQGAAVSDHPNVLGPRRSEQMRQAVFQALAAAQLAAAGLARAQALERRHELRALADEGIAGALGRATLAQDPPGDSFRDAQDLLQGLAVDPGGKTACREHRWHRQVDERKRVGRAYAKLPHLSM